MRDDVATLTNAYPDHEDIQGPAGHDVADVISRFVPHRATLVTSEDNFLPVFADAAKDRGTELLHVPERDAELLGDDLLARFPYQEHPRNIALVARLAEHLGIDRTYAIALMAAHVVPELGNLKVFPAARVLGRELTFINGHSANERTGFLNNWKRTGCDAVDCVTEPDRVVVTVVNNRWDRVARSEVFARILVEDAAADRHVLIGTNLLGLVTYVEGALDRHLEAARVMAPEEAGTASGREAAHRRLTDHLARLRLPPPAAEHATARLRVFARGAGLELAEESIRRIAAAVEALLATRAEASLESAHRDVRGDDALARALDDAFASASPLETSEDPPEALEAASIEEVRAHFTEFVAASSVSARLHALVDAGTDADAVNAAFRSACRELFLAKVEVVHDAAASGDRIIERCARAVPPGTRATIMGLQNIKGTGLDWVYRWVALDAVRTWFDRIARGDAEAREQALRELEAFEDHGLVDAALAKSRVAGLVLNARSPDEKARFERLREKLERAHEARRVALSSGQKTGPLERALGWVERGLDALDSVHRRRQAERIVDDLVHQRISHPRAVLELRRLNARQKGGWLVAAVRGAKR